MIIHQMIFFSSCRDHRCYYAISLTRYDLYSPAFTRRNRGHIICLCYFRKAWYSITPLDKFNLMLILGEIGEPSCREEFLMWEVADSFKNKNLNTECK